MKKIGKIIVISVAVLVAVVSGYEVLRVVGAGDETCSVMVQYRKETEAKLKAQIKTPEGHTYTYTLVPAKDGGMVPAFEVMQMNTAIRNMIRDSKTYQIDTVIQTSAAEGMISMDQSLLRLYKEGKITEETALEYAVGSEQMKRKL